MRQIFRPWLSKNTLRSTIHHLVKKLLKYNWFIRPGVPPKDKILENDKISQNGLNSIKIHGATYRQILYQDRTTAWEY